MGEIIAAGVVIVLGTAGLVGFAELIVRSNRRRALEHAAVPAITAADAVSKLQQQYRITQRAVRALEEVLRRDRTVPFLSEDEQREFKQIIDEFYSE